MGRGIAFIRQHADYHGDDCIVWPFAIDTYNGYPIFGFEGKVRKGHRY